jgi:hypothetical protein
MEQCVHLSRLQPSRKENAFWLKLAYLAASIAITMIERNGGHAIEIKEIHKVAPSFTDK